MSETEEQKPGSSSAAEADIAEPEAEQEQETEEEPEDIDAEALDLMGQGKRNLVVGDPPAAVQCFQEACELLASKYGETAEECGDAYYQYGCSLLELASMENGVLGNALQGVPDESADSADSDEEVEQKPSGSNIESADKLEDKEREEVIQQVKDALEANFESEESEKEDKGKEGGEGQDEKMEEGGDSEDVEEKGAKDEKKNEKKEDAKIEKKEKEKKTAEEESKKEKEDSKQEKVEEKKDEVKSDEKKDVAKADKAPVIETEKKESEKEKKEVDKKTEKKDDDEEAGPSTEDEQKEDGEDISNFQLAWEMLELSRVILGKKEDEESQKKVSQIHLKLGELGLETEQYTQSIVDFKACLVIQEKYLDPESRLIAGTHYNLGLACSFDQKFDESIEHYRESKQLIEKRLANLEKTVSETEGKGKEKADEKDPIVCAQKEIDELKELLPDVVSKLEDAKEMKLQAGTLSDGAGPSSSTSSGFASSSSAFAPSSSTEPIQQIAVKKADSGSASDISHLVRKKRKPEETDAAADSKRSRQEGEAEKPAVNGSGDSKVVNGNGHMANGVMNGDATNGDSKYSPEKPSEIKTKKLASADEAPAAMETA